MPHFNEHALEMSIMELFQQEGYIYTNGEEIHKEVSDVLLRDDLRAYLRGRYGEAGITPLEIERAVAKLTANVGFSLYENNLHTYRLMVEGFSLKRDRCPICMSNQLTLARRVCRTTFSGLSISWRSKGRRPVFPTGLSM